MKRDSISGGTKSSRTYEVLEAIVREKVQEFIQDILEEEVSEFLGRGNRNERNLSMRCWDIVMDMGSPGDSLFKVGR